MLEPETLNPTNATSSLAWVPPPRDQVALSVDGAFSKSDDTAVADMILRYHDGTIIFAAYRFMFHCNDALEAEIHVLMQGMSLAMQHTELSVVVQSDSSIALSIFRDDSLVCPSYGNLALEIKSLREKRVFIP